MLSPLDRREIKGVVRLAVSDAGGQENACNISRITRHKSFSEYGDAEIADRQMPIDVAIDLDQFNGKPGIVRWMARRLGFVLVKAPQVAPAASAVDALLTSAEASAHAVSAGWAANADGVFTPEEKTDLRGKIDDAVEALEAFRMLLDDGVAS